MQIVAAYEKRSQGGKCHSHRFIFGLHVNFVWTGPCQREKLFQPKTITFWKREGSIHICDHLMNTAVLGQRLFYLGNFSLISWKGARSRVAQSFSKMKYRWQQSCSNMLPAVLSTSKLPSLRSTMSWVASGFQLIETTTTCLYRLVP